MLWLPHLLNTESGSDSPPVCEEQWAERCFFPLEWVGSVPISPSDGAAHRLPDPRPTEKGSQESFVGCDLLTTGHLHK